MTDVASAMWRRHVAGFSFRVVVRSDRAAGAICLPDGQPAALARSRQPPQKAPLYFIICVDAHRHETVMGRRGWELIENDLSLLLLGIQDASIMAQNMVIAAESVGLGSCFLGHVPHRATMVAEKFRLPPRVFPLVGLVVGYPAENPPPRSRYPLDFALFEEQYPAFADEQVKRAMATMDQGYLAQDYYASKKIMIPLEGDREETFTFDTYSWTEHISRKAGQWWESPDELLEQFAQRGFQIPGNERQEAARV